MTTLPTLLEIYEGYVAQYEAEYGDTISTLQKAALRVEAAVNSAKDWVLYKVLASVQKNVWPDTADPEARGGTLERFGRVRLGRDSFPAVAGQYTVQVTGTIGSTIPAQATLKSNDDSRNPGKIYTLDNAYPLVSNPDTIIIRALTAGLDGKLDVGDTLNFTSPIPGVNKQVTVTIESTQPLAAETKDAYRTKTLESFRIEAQGGSPGDYRIWSGDAQGVRRVYPYPKAGETNANIIYVEANVDDSIDGMGTPTQAILDEVEEVTNFSPDTTLDQDERGRRPCTVINYFEGTTPFLVDITINGSNFTATQQTKITHALEDAVDMIRPFITAADIADERNDTIDTNKINGIIYGQVPGATYTNVDLEINSVPYLSYNFIDGNIPFLNSVTFS